MYLEVFNSGILKLFEENFHQGIKFHIIYINLTDINIRTVLILFSSHLPSIYIPNSSSAETLGHLSSLLFTALFHE